MYQKTENTLNEIFQGEWNLHAYKQLQYKNTFIESHEEETIPSLMDWYQNKRSGKVSYAGMRLKKMLPFLPSKEQYEITLLLLQGSKTDAEYVAQYLNAFRYNKTHKPITWRDEYIPLVKQAWERHHGPSLAQLVIQYMTIDYVRTQAEALSEIPKVYFELCRRLVHDRTFKIDTHKLKALVDINAYLFILSESKLGITSQEARRLLYQWIAITASLYSDPYYYRSVVNLPFFHLSLRQLQGLDTAIYLLLEMEQEDVVKQFVAWSRLVDNKLWDKKQEFRRNCIGSNTENHIQLANLIIENLPEDLVYIAHPQEDYRNHIHHIAHPFAEIPPYILDAPEERSENKTSESLEATTTRLNTPLAQKLMEELGDTKG